MAIGDTVNAGLMRVDFSPIQRAGEAQARANQAFGQTIGNVLDKFYEKKREKAQQESIADTLVSTFGVNREEANHLSKNKEFIPTFFEQQKAQRDYELQLDKFNLQQEQNNQALERQQKADLLADKARQKEEAQAQIYDQFLSSPEMINMPMGVQDQNPLMRGVPQPTAQVPQGEYKGNRFFQTEQGKSDFTSLVDAGMDESDALEMASKREAQFLASQKPQKIARTITMQDSEGNFRQVGVDEVGDPVRDFGPPKPSGMYPTPEEKTKEIIEVGRTKDAMETVKNTVNESNLAIKQAEQAELALTNLPETTGGITSFINDMKVLAESVGIDLPEEYQKDMKDIGVFRQVTGQFLFNAMSNTKGSITEKEMTLFRKISPDIDNSRAANEAMLKLYVKAGQRAKGRRDLIRSLQKQKVNPVLIQEQIEKFDEENSLMGDIQALAPNSTTKTKFNFNGQNIDVEIVGERKDGTPIYKDKKTGQILVQQPAQ